MHQRAAHKSAAHVREKSGTLIVPPSRLLVVWDACRHVLPCIWCSACSCPRSTLAISFLAVLFLSLAVLFSSFFCHLRFCGFVFVCGAGFCLRCRFLFAVQVVLRIGSQSVAPDGLQRHSPRGSPLFEKCWCPLGSPASPRSDQPYRRWLVKLACALPRVEKEYVPSFGSATRARQCKSMPSRS